MHLPSTYLTGLYALALILFLPSVLASSTPQFPFTLDNLDAPSAAENKRNSVTSSNPNSTLSIEHSDRGRYFYASTSASICCRADLFTLAGAVYSVKLDAIPISAVKPFWKGELHAEGLKEI